MRGLFNRSNRLRLASYRIKVDTCLFGSVARPEVVRLIQVAHGGGGDLVAHVLDGGGVLGDLAGHLGLLLGGGGDLARHVGNQRDGLGDLFERGGGGIGVFHAVVRQPWLVCIRLTARAVVCCSVSMVDWISWVESWVRWDSTRTSSATTAKPRPCSPARAASMAR